MRERERENVRRKISGKNGIKRVDFDAQDLVRTMRTSERASERMREGGSERKN